MGLRAGHNRRRRHAGREAVSASYLSCRPTRPLQPTPCRHARRIMLRSCPCRVKHGAAEGKTLGVTMHCPRCNSGMIEGDAELHGTFLGFLVVGWSYQKLFFHSKDAPRTRE